MATWIATWSGTDPNHVPKKKLALVVDGRTGAETVRKLVQAIFASYWYSEGELVAYRLEKHNPYPAKFGDLKGITWQGQISCGHNPHLFARLVDDLKADSLGNVTWKERPRPNPRLPRL